ncbi:hypothetical protein FRC02_005530 [Tulasnella sp. 418]|nr:hypothetical protein FRC02_005530 [Tulasnella sp. 418]
MGDTGEGCLSLCCGAIGICFASTLQTWCNFRACGVREGGGNRGCCPNLGSFDEDEWDKEDAKAAKKRAEAKQTVSSQPDASPSMNKDVGSDTNQATTKPSTTGGTTTA